MTAPALVSSPALTCDYAGGCLTMERVREMFTEKQDEIFALQDQLEEEQRQKREALAGLQMCREKLQLYANQIVELGGIPL